MNPSRLVDLALALTQEHGLSVLPVAGHDWEFEYLDTQTGETVRGPLKKKPACLNGHGPQLLKWDAWKQRRMTEQEVRRFFAKPPNIGVIMGAVSGYAEAIDFDEAGAYENWREILEENGLNHVLDRLFIQATQTPGHFQAIYRCPEGIEGGQKLAHYYDETDLDRHGRPKRKGLIETRGEGNYVVCTPSEGYVAVQGDVRSIPAISSNERAALIHAARMLCRAPEETEPPKEKRDRTQSQDLLPGEDFEAKAEWASILEPHGWAFIRTRGPLSYWRRPGKSRNEPGATTGLGRVGQDLMRVFTSNADPLQENHTYGKFRAYAILNHGGDVSKAAAELRRQGYGTAKPSEQRIKDHSPAAAVDQEGATGQGHSPDTDRESDDAPGYFMSARIPWSVLKNRPPKPMLIDGLIGERDSAMLAGKRKGGKSAVLIDLMLACIAGGTFCDRFEVVRPLNVAYFTTEGLGALHTRIEYANHRYRIPDHVLERSLHVFGAMPQIFDETAKGRIMGFVEEWQKTGWPLDLIVVDTLAKAIRGANENDNSEMSLALATLGEARDALNVASLLAHHVGKAGGDSRGASAIEGDLDILAWVDWDEKENKRTFKYGFAKDLGDFPAVGFTLKVHDKDLPGAISVDWDWAPVGAINSRDMVVRAMRQAPDDYWTSSQIVTMVGGALGRTAVLNALTREAGRDDARIEMVKPEGTGQILYRLTEAGK